MTAGFLEEPPITAQGQSLYDEDVATAATYGTCPGFGPTSQTP
jgi:hypothetical protein